MDNETSCDQNNLETVFTSQPLYPMIGESNTQRQFAYKHREKHSIVDVPSERKSSLAYDLRLAEPERRSSYILASGTLKFKTWLITIKTNQPKMETSVERKPITDKLANKKCGTLRRSRRFRRRRQARPLPNVPAKNPMTRSEMSANTTPRETGAGKWFTIEEWFIPVLDVLGFRLLPLVSED
ncbi:hypothetical protein ACROYT_G006790 [Oculina patagonica]